MTSQRENAAERLLAQCKWPPLAPHYAHALREAVTFVLRRFDVLGVFACGTIIRGKPDKSSDLDVYVVHREPKRQRIQKFFHEVPAEIFVNPVKSIEGYFATEQYEGRPRTAHMLATGFVVLDLDPAVERLRRRAHELLASKADLGADRLNYLRYSAALQYEDARDIALTNPAGATMILGLAVHNMLQYCFWAAGRLLPREKDLLLELEELDAEIAGLARKFYEADHIEQRLFFAENMARQIIGKTGFFEWESPLEDVP